ncbi:MAG TPA: LLM class flavin-dependent oxidoreductase [Chloroflexota bacterium]|jgi:alkanesulfonate monooxygenase SsuD/methylene tetrahydromethanopterin reductase-like flavin-dependent oxidoreductase (luciferase family)
MRIGFHLTPFWSPTDRSPTQILDEAIEVVAAASKMGYGWVSIGHHWLSHPTIWPQPFPVLARLAPETGAMQLKTSVLLMPLMNPVDVAENGATLDHISHGRFVLGMSVGYRAKELEAVGLTRKDRGAKLEESIRLIKQLWTADEPVTFEGRYTKITEGRMGFRPYQEPHPPIELGAQSDPATKRAARIADGVFFGPQAAWADVKRLAGVYRAEREAQGRPGLGILGSSRSLLVGKSKQDAAARARAYLDKTFNMYKTWEMQEPSMVGLQLEQDINLDDWTIHGSPADCVEVLLRARDEIGLNAVGVTIYSLPPSPRERIEYLQMIAEEIVAKVAEPSDAAGGVT